MSSSNGSSSIQPDSLMLRLCHLKKFKNFNGYGFNLRSAEHWRYVGRVDIYSPAWYAHLKDGDRIVECNGVSVDTRLHSLGELVRLVKRGYECDATGRLHTDECTLLVVDAETDQFYESMRMPLNTRPENVYKYYSIPPSKKIPSIKPLNQLRSQLATSTTSADTTTSDTVTITSKTGVIKTIQGGAAVNTDDSDDEDDSETETTIYI